MRGMSEVPRRGRPRYSVRMLLVAMTIAAGLIWQGNIVRERKALVVRARKSGVSIEYRGEPTLIRTLMGDRTVWSIDIPPDSEFYGYATELRRAFPEAYINHLGPVIEAVEPAVPIFLDIPPPSPPLRSAWWGF